MKKSPTNKSKSIITKAKNTSPRLVVFRSNKEIYGQIIALDGKVLVAASGLKIKEKKNKTLVAEIVGKNLADKAKKAKIHKVIFDRRKYKYHGRVSALAKGAREGGLKF